MTTQTRIPEAVFKQLCDLERKLHKWAEDECNGAIQWIDDQTPRRYRKDPWGDHTIPGQIIPNRELVWLTQAQTLATQCGGAIYHQTDPRGCTLYFYRESDLDGYSYPIEQIYSTVALACCE